MNRKTFLLQYVFNYTLFTKNNLEKHLHIVMDYVKGRYTIRKVYICCENCKENPFPYYLTKKDHLLIEKFLWKEKNEKK